MMTATYYNEFDPYAAQWLRNLIAAGHLPPGDVDERSICDVSPDDLKGYRQAHFFAGVGGWPLALRMAGVPDDAPIWTGSCPCQPFSAAGKQKGKDDERHLWPVFRGLIAERRPEFAFGEQVAPAIAHGWADDLQADLAAENYAVGCVVLGAHSVGAPHIRQRLYWGARLADAVRQQQHRRGDAGSGRRAEFADGGEPVWMGHALGAGLERHAGHGDEGDEPGRNHPLPTGPTPPTGDAGFWSRSLPYLCRDGKARLIEPGVFPLAHGVPGRVGRLRAYGNAIVPQVGAAFVTAFMESL